MTIHVNRFRIRKRLLNLLVQSYIVDWKVFTLATICLIKKKLGLDVRLQNTQIVILKSPSAVMQITTLNAHVGLRSELVDWYRDALFFRYGHLLTELSTRTDNQIRYCANIGYFPSRIYFPDRLKILKSDEHTNVRIIFPQTQKFSNSALHARIYRVSLRMHCNSARRKHLEHKKTNCDKVSKRCLIVISKKMQLEAKKQLREFLLSKKNLQLKKLLVVQSLTICLDMRQFVLVPASLYKNTSLDTQAVTQQELLKHQAEQNLAYKTDSL